MENKLNFRIARIGLLIYFAGWIVLEGSLWQTLLLSFWIMAVEVAFWGSRWKRSREAGWWVGLSGIVGGVAGTLTAPLTLVLMALKTGLHAHGAEFTLMEMEWVIHQMPLWGIIGLCLGLSVGFFRAGTH